MSIRSKAIFSVASIQIIIMSILIIYGVNMIINLTQENLNKEHYFFTKTISEIATPAILNKNKAETNRLMKKIEGHPEIQSITVMDNLNNIIYKSQKNIHITQDTESLTIPIFSNDKPVAYMEVETSTHFTDKIFAELLTSNIFAAILSIIIIIGIAVFLGAALTRRVEAIKQAATAIRAGQMGYVIPNYVEDELTEAISSINSMSSQLDMNRQELEETIVKFQKSQAKLAANEELLVKKNQISEAVSYLQSLYIDNTNRTSLFDKVKQIFINITKAEHFLVGEVTPDNRLSLLALTDMSWDDETRAQYKHHQEGGEFIIDSMDNLLGQVLIQKKPMILLHPRLEKASKGHPGLKNYLGLPIIIREKVVGLIALADHPNGFSSHLPDLLEPLTNCCGNLILAFQDKIALAKAQEDIAALKASLYQDIMENFPRPIFILDLQLKVVNRNQRATQIANLKKFSLFTDCLSDQEKNGFFSAVEIASQSLKRVAEFEIFDATEKHSHKIGMWVYLIQIDDLEYFLITTKEQENVN